MNIINILESNTTNTPLSITGGQSAVYQIQTFLRELALVHQEIPLILADGIFGPQTTQAVVQFQLLHGLPPTGVVDYRTWTMLAAEYVAVLQLQRKPLSCSMFPSGVESITLGDQGDTIYFIQIMLQTLSRHFDNLPRVEITGVYDEQTRDAVTHFQELERLESTGDVNKATWDRLVLVFSVKHSLEDLIFRPQVPAQA